MQTFNSGGEKAVCVCVCVCVLLKTGVESDVFFTWLLSFFGDRPLDSSQIPCRACVCVCFGSEETVPPRCEAESLRQQVQLTQIRFLAGRGQLGAGQRGEKSERRNARSDLSDATGQMKYF